MFSKDSVDMATQIAISLKSNNKFLKPTDHALVNVLSPVLTPLIGAKGITINDESLQNALSNIITTSIENKEIAGENYNTLQELVDHLTNTISINVELVRNIALPMIRNVSDTVVRRMADTSEQILSRNQVRIVTPPVYHIFHDDSFVSVIDKFTQHNFGNGKVSGVNLLPECDYEFIKGLLTTGQTSFDNVTNSILESVSAEYITAIFNNTFVNTSNKALYTQAGSDKMNSLIMNLIIFLVASNLNEDNIPEGINVSFKELSIRLLEARGTAASIIRSIMKEYLARETTKGVVFTEYTFGVNNIRVVEVVESVYNEGTEKGLTVEILSGALLEPGASTYLPELLKNADKHISRFNIANQKADMEISKLRKETVISTIIENIASVLRTNNGEFELKSGTFKFHQNVSELSKIVNEYYDSRSAELNTTTITKIVQETILSALFDNTMVPDIIHRMEAITDSGENTTPSYLGVVSITTLLVESLLKMMTVTTQFN